MAGEFKSAIPRMLGMMVTAWAVRRLSGEGSLFTDTQNVSPMMGESWTWKQYGIALAVATWAPKFVGKWINATEFRRGATDLILQKFVWTEGLSRSDWGKRMFGNSPGPVGIGPGNQAYYGAGGQWNAMQGIVEASPLDGIVEASPLDGVDSYSYGHLLPSGVSSETAKRAAYQGSGYKDPFHAAFA